jgi:hypothetical protein
MRTRYMPWHQFFAKLKQLPREEPFTLGLSDESGARAKEFHVSALKKESQSIPTPFRIRKEPESINDLRGQSATRTRTASDPSRPRG